jgi:hypothetical protein
MKPYPERRKTLNVLKESSLVWGSFDDFPVVPEGVEPSPHLSRNKVPQPFYLITSQDEVLVTMAGEGEVRFQDPERTVLRIGPGDVVYLPARLPSRIVPDSELIQVRIKDVPPFTEAVAWFCDACGNLLYRVEFTAAVPQRHYWAAVLAYNTDPTRRTCESCRHEHGPIDLGGLAWDEVADALEATAT